MTTHRSLNKLEFKAHMSIHNFVEVPEAEGEGLAWTRDRFGKKQLVADSAGVFRITRRSAQVSAVLVAAALASFLAVSSEAAERHHTNIQVDSAGIDMFSSETSSARPERPVFYQDDSTSVGMNEDGDPNLSMHF